jgi:chromosome segregation ATPase
MSKNLDLIIKSLQTELQARGIQIENETEKPKINNSLNELNNNNLLKSQSLIKNKNEERKIKDYIETCLYNTLMPLKVEIKSTLEKINFKMNNFENELLKINLMNDNIRTFNTKLSKIENDYNLLYKNFSMSNSLSVQNKENYENINTNIKTYMDDTNNEILKLKNEMNNITKNQKDIEKKYNFGEYNNNFINNEQKIIGRINDLYKEKENNLSILSTNLFTKVNDYSTQTDNKLEIIYNSINEIKQKLNNANNNVNLLNDLPSIKEISMNNNKEIESLKSKIETISKADDIKTCKEDVENTKNDIQIIKTDIEEINKLKNQNINLNNEIQGMKNNMKLFEKKMTTMEGNFFNLDGVINDNKKEIIKIKKEKLDNKSKNNLASVNDDILINERLNKLNNIIAENNKTITDFETFFKTKIKEQSKVYNENFHNINKRMETFNNEEIKINEENSKLIEIMSKKIMDNNDIIKKIMESDIKVIFDKFEIINRNFKSMNKYYTKINELDKIVKENIIKSQV